MHETDWQSIDAHLHALATREAEHAYEVGVWLLLASRARVHERLAYGSLGEYAERVFGYSPRHTYERVRVAQALESLPLLREALQQGTLPWSAVRELTRVAVPETEGQWLEAAQERAVHQVEKMVKGLDKGALPYALVDPSRVTQAMRFELGPEAEATVRQALAAVRAETGEALTEEEALLEVCRRSLGQGGDPGRASYQVSVTVCERCERAWQHADGRVIEVPAEVGERARCDAQEVGSVRPQDLTHVGNGVPRARRPVPPAVRRQVTLRDGGCCTTPGCRNRKYVDVHHLTPVSEGGTNEPDSLALLCGVHHHAVHRGLLWIEGRPSTGLRFRHADGTVYGRAPTPALVQVHRDAFGALRNLGFRERECHRMMQRARTHVGADVDVPTLVAAALRRDGSTTSESVGPALG
jgi:5-methylcytosine-specific restriction endonuclease McrA